MFASLVMWNDMILYDTMQNMRNCRRGGLRLTIAIPGDDVSSRRAAHRNGGAGEGSGGTSE